MRRSFTQEDVSERGRIGREASLAVPKNTARSNKGSSPALIAGMCFFLLILGLILSVKAPLVLAGLAAILLIGGIGRLCWVWWKRTTDQQPTPLLALPAPASLLLPKHEDKRDQARTPLPGKEVEEEDPLRLFEEQRYLLPPALLRSANTLVIEDPQDEPGRACAFLVFFEELTRKSRRPLCVWTTQTAHLALVEGNEACLLVGHPRADSLLSPETRSRFVPLATPQQAKMWSSEFLNRKQHALVLLSTYPDEESAAQILTTMLGAIEEIIRGEPARSALMIVHQANRFLPKDGDQGLDLFMNETLAREIRSFLLNLLLDGPTIGLPFCLFADEVTCMEPQALESCRIWMVNKVPWFDTSNAQHQAVDELSLVRSCLRLSSVDLSPLGRQMALLADRGVPPEKIKWKSFRPLPSPWTGSLVPFNWPQIERPIDSVGVAGEADAAHFAPGQGDTLSSRYKAYMCVLLRYYPTRATVSQIINPSPDWLPFLEEIGIDPDNPLPIMEVQTLLVTVRKGWDNNEDEIARTLYQKYSHLLPPLHQARSAPRDVRGKEGSPQGGDASGNHHPLHQPPFSEDHQDGGVADCALSAIGTRQMHVQTEQKPPARSGTEVSQKALPFGDIPRMEDLPSLPHRQGGQMPERQDRSFPTSSWILPHLGLLASPQRTKAQTFDDETAKLAQTIARALHSFRVEASVREEDISIGPTVIRFGIRPTGKPELIKDEKTGKMVPVRDAANNIVYEVRTRVSRIMALQNDLALVLEAKTIRMEAPVPGRPYVGVEIPNKNSRLVTLREVLESEEYQAAQSKSKLSIGLGRDVAGQVRIGDLARMPHLLIAGATGSGKSVLVNAIIASILTQATPDDVRLLMIDPKMVELNMYNGIPHLLSPVVTEVGKVVPLLKNAIHEMERRYRLFSKLSVRHLDGYRKLRLEKFREGDTQLPNLPAIVIIIDELADLMMAAPEEVEGMICRLAQLARATGIHLVVATQRPSVDVITGLIKANIPTRISFMVSSAIDSRTIIDMGGAERLLGRGDMLYLPADAGRPERIQGSFLTDEETEKLVVYWRQQVEEYRRQLALAQPTGEERLTPLPEVEPGWEIVEQLRDDLEPSDELISKAEEVVRECGRASISLLQRRLRVGYSRAARLIDLLEEHGVIGQFGPGRRIREVYPLEEEEKDEMINPVTQAQPEESESLLEEKSGSTLTEIPPISRGDLLAEQELSQGNPGEEDRPLASQEKPDPPHASFLLEKLSIYWLLLEMRNHKGAGNIPTPRDQRNAPKHEMHLVVAAHILWSGAVSTDNIRDFLPISKDTIKRILGELVAMGMLVEGGRGRHLRRDMHLAQLSPELHALRDFFLSASASVKRNNPQDELLLEAQETEASGACSLLDDAQFLP